jgi:hypothetical protein
MYLLLTCADTLGHCYPSSGRVRDRFFAFFGALPGEDKELLTAAILVWHTDDRAETVLRGLPDPNTTSISGEPHQPMRRLVQELSKKERFDAVVKYLYFVRRNPFTHEAFFPQLGYHPNLAVLQQLRLGVPDVADLGDLNRFQCVNDGTHQYLVYYECEDPVEVLWTVIVRGLGQIIRRGLP